MYVSLVYFLNRYSSMDYNSFPVHDYFPSTMKCTLGKKERSYCIFLLFWEFSFPV